MYSLDDIFNKKTYVGNWWISLDGDADHDEEWTFNNDELQTCRDSIMGPFRTKKDAIGWVQRSNAANICKIYGDSA